MLILPEIQENDKDQEFGVNRDNTECRRMSLVFCCLTVDIHTWRLGIRPLICIIPVQGIRMKRCVIWILWIQPPFTALEAACDVLGSCHIVNTVCVRKIVKFLFLSEYKQTTAPSTRICFCLKTLKIFFVLPLVHVHPMKTVPTKNAEFWKRFLKWKFLKKGRQVLVWINVKTTATVVQDCFHRGICVVLRKWCLGQDGETCWNKRVLQKSDLYSSAWTRLLLRSRIF